MLTEVTYERYFRAHYQEALGYACKKIPVFSDAEDLVMEAFAACYQKREQFNEEKASFRTWFFVVLGNKIKNYYRDHREQEELDDSYQSPGVFEDEMAEAQYISSMRSRLAEALKTLNDTQQKILILKYFKGFENGEIADRLGIRPGNVRIQAMRALGKLRDYCEEHNIRWEK